jgi:hypothetical protein
MTSALWFRPPVERNPSESGCPFAGSRSRYSGVSVTSKLWTTRAPLARAVVSVWMCVKYSIPSRDHVIAGEDRTK